MIKIGSKSTILFICLAFQVSAFSQLRLDDIVMDQISQKKVRQYIEYQIEDNKHLFNQIHPSCTASIDLSAYHKNIRDYILKDNIQKVWFGYLSANPTQSWNGRKVSFGLLLNKYPENIFYNNDQIAGVDTGQVYYVNLKLMEGMYNLPVAFEIVRVDNNSKVIEFSYLEGNKSTGLQRIEFFDLGNDYTKIIHTSFYKSDSEFRDKWLYPHFHKKIINDFHRNMRKLLGV